MLVNAKYIEQTGFHPVPSRGGSGHQHQFKNVRNEAQVLGLSFGYAGSVCKYRSGPLLTQRG